MTNLEKVLEVDREDFLKEISQKICFCTSKHTVMTVQPPLCGECGFGERLCNGKWKCHTEEIVEWLKSEVDE